MIGTQDLIIILVIVLVLFGVKRLPEIGKGIGEGLKGLKKGLSEPDEIDVTPKKEGRKKEEPEKKEDPKDVDSH